MTPNYDRWRKRLEYVAAGIKPKDWPVDVFATTDGATADDCGFYRKPIKERQPNGQWKLLGYKPVALYVADGELQCCIGGVYLSPSEREEDFLWFVSHPITEDIWRAVAERHEPWPDNPAPPDIHIPGVVSNREPREITNADNNPPEILTDKDHGTAIDNAIAAAIKVVTNEAEAAQALGSKNRIAELRLAADKAGKAEYEPPYAEYKRLYGAWNPPVKRAEAKEKELNTAILTFRESERRRIAKEQAIADAKQREIDEANERAAQRAIAAGEPEAMPETIEIAAPAAPAPILPTYGTRKIKEELHTILDAITDYDAVYNFLKAEPKVKVLLFDLATAKVKAGFTVPGTTTRQGLI